MNDADSPTPPTQPSPGEPKRGLPARYWVGQDLAWDSPHVPVSLCVELPFWFMAPLARLSCHVGGHGFDVQVVDDYFELHVGGYSDAKRTCLWTGPYNPDAIKRAIDFAKEAAAKHKQPEPPVSLRKCKTVLIVATRLREGILAARGGDDPRLKRQAIHYLDSWVSAHVPVVNHVVQRYRLATYDMFAFEIAPWDIPFSTVRRGDSGDFHCLSPYRSWDDRPMMQLAAGAESTPLELLDADALLKAMALEPFPGEFDLLDAINLMERGDYSGAVRRVTTAIETAVEHVLRLELSKLYSQVDVEDRLTKSQSDFPGRLRQYQKLCGRTMPDALARELDRTREMRHEIVHRSYRVPFAERGSAQRSVDTGRWIYNWIEECKDRFQVREGRIALRSIGRFMPIFDASITEDGVEVYPPPMAAEDPPAVK